MYRPLSFQHPHAWLSSLPPKRWSYDNEAKKWKLSFPPTRREDITREYLGYLLGCLDGHALRLLNLEWSPDDDTAEELAATLERHALAAGLRVEVTFHAGRVSDRQVVAGQLSSRWLRERCRMAAEAALAVWDPHEAQRLHDRAVRGGQKSKRSKVFTPSMLPPGSIAAQADALGCSRRTIARLRRAQREAA